LRDTFLGIPVCRRAFLPAPFIKLFYRRIELQRVNDIPRQRVSCEYVDVDEITLSLIQRYINKLEVGKIK
jgi:hypothetical protein